MQYVWLVLVMFGNPHRLYPVNIFSGVTKGNSPHKSTYTCKRLHTCNHMWMSTHTHTMVGKWPWKARLKLLHNSTPRSSCSISYVFGHIKSLQSVVFVSSSVFMLSETIRLLVLWMISLFLARLKLFKAHLQQGSDPFRLFLCKANSRGGMMHISRMLSRGWRAEFLPK